MSDYVPGQTYIVGTNGTLVKTSDDGQLLVDTKSAAMYAAQKGDAYSVVGAADSGAETSDFFYLKNHDKRDLVIYKIRMYTPTLDLIINVKLGVTGSPDTGTAVAPGNMKVGGSLANVTCEQRDGDMALTGGTTVDTLYLDKDFIGEQSWDYPGGIILPQNAAMVYYVNIDPTADVSSETFFFFADPQ